ncbi:MAG: isoprenylcysteine carboxylmethyltransferase family protein [Bryobacteraceae bacterium]
MWLPIAWTVFGAAFVWNHLRIRLRRSSEPEKRVHRDPSSNWGLLLQAAGVFVLLAFPVPHRVRWDLFAATIAGVSIGLTFSALHHLGRQWRIQAVVTDDHALITSGPYSWVRHPVYLAFLGMFVATAMARASAWSGLTAVAIFLVGTAIRIRAEDRILSAAFPNQFPAYRDRVGALFPKLR